MTTTDRDLRDRVAELLMHHTYQTELRPYDLRVVPGGPAGGCDIALILDGGYTDRRDAQEVAEHWRERLHDVLADLDATYQDTTPRA